MTDYYVSPGGSDVAAGTSWGTARRQITAVVSLVTAGSTVYVAPGTYNPFEATVAGTVGSRITWRSTDKWGAKIFTAGTGVTETAVYNDLIGFEVSDHNLVMPGGWNALIYVDGNFSRVIDCHCYDFPLNTSAGTAVGILGEGWNAGGYNGQGIEIHRCVVHGIAAGAWSSTAGHGIYVQVPDCVVNGNLVYDCHGDLIEAWHSATRLIAINNTLVGTLGANGNNGAILVGNGDAGGTAAGHTGALIANNILVNNGQGAGADQSQLGSATISNQWRNNQLYGNGAGNAFVLYANSIQSGTLTTDPLFVDPATRNYRLQTGSPAINSGYASASNPTIDLSDRVRPGNSSTQDRGAYEVLPHTPSIASIASSWR